LFDVGHAFACVVRQCAQFFTASRRGLAFRFELFQLLRAVLLLFAPFLLLQLQLLAARMKTVARFADVLDFGFQAADEGRRFVEPPCALCTASLAA